MEILAAGTVEIHAWEIGPMLSVTMQQAAMDTTMYRNCTSMSDLLVNRQLVIHSTLYLNICYELLLVMSD